MLRSVNDHVQERRGSARFDAEDAVEIRLRKFASELFVRSSRGHFIAKVLSTEAGQNSFLTFLKTNHRQNIDFLLAVETLKEVAGSDEFFELAKEVINRYLKPAKHEKEVDVKPENCEKVFIVMENVSKGSGDMIGVLDLAEEDVLDHLAAGAFDAWIAANPEISVPADVPEVKVNKNTV